jgi:branched-chain amino acid transport system substrate-binding protein
MMARWKFFCKCLVLLVALFLSPGIPLAQGVDSVRIGILLPLTGPMAGVGEVEKQSFEMAVEKINTKGGINGKKLNLLIRDTSSRVDVGRAMAERLIKKYGVSLIGGGCSSSVAYTVARVCQENQTPFLINTAADDKITTSGWDYVFRMNPPFSKYASGLASLFSKVVRPKTAVILHEDSPFGTERAKFFAEFCERSGIDLLMNRGYKRGEIDFGPALTRVKDKNPDILFMISHTTDGSTLMKQARDLELTPKMFVAGSGNFTLPEFQRQAGIASQDVIACTLWNQHLPFPGAMDFYRKFEGKYQMPPDYHAAEAYAACSVIADALSRAKSLNGTDIREALLRTDLMTLFGPIKFTTWEKMKNQSAASTYVVQWIDGKLELVWPKNLATDSLVYPMNWRKD